MPWDREDIKQAAITAAVGLGALTYAVLMMVLITGGW